MENFLLIVTPNIFICSILSKPGTAGGGISLRRRLLGGIKTISADFVRLSCKLLATAYISTLLISAVHDLAFEAGTIKYVSSAYFTIKFPAVTGCRSAAVRT
jgi:hypothetical protein